MAIFDTIKKFFTREKATPIPLSTPIKKEEKKPIAVRPSPTPIQKPTVLPVFDAIQKAVPKVISPEAGAKFEQKVELAKKEEEAFDKPFATSVMSAIDTTYKGINKYGFEYPSRIVGGRIAGGLETSPTKQFDFSSISGLRKSIEAQPTAFEAIQKAATDKGLPSPVGAALGFLAEAAIPGPGELEALTKPNILKSLVKETDEGIIRRILTKEAKLPEEKAAALAKEVAPLKTEDEIMKVLRPEKTAPEVKKYQTIHEGGVLKSVDGEPVKIIDDVETFVHKGDGGWIVSEASTGRVLAESASKDGAIAKANFNINNVGKDKFLKLVEENKIAAPGKVEFLPKEIRVDEEAKKVGAKRIAPDRIAHQQVSPEAAKSKLIEKARNTAQKNSDSWISAAKKIDALIEKYGGDLPKRTEENIGKYPDLLSDGSLVSQYKKSAPGARTLTDIKDSFLRSAERNGWTEAKEKAYLSRVDDDYKDLVRKDISKGYKYPDEVLGYDKSFKTAVDNRARYEKGLRTSFSADDERIVFDAENRIVAGMKRQDGKPISPKQQKEIIDGVLQTQNALGINLNKLSKDERWVFVHLNDKNPFLTREAAGLYRKTGDSVSVSLGGTEAFEVVVNGEKIKKKVNTTISHEIGHALDFNQGGNLIDQQTFYELRNTFKPVEYGFRGDKYWKSKTEVTARAVEEYVAVREGHLGIFDKPGYWSKEIFESKIKPEIEKSVDEKFSEYKALPEAPVKNIEPTKDFAVKKMAAADAETQKLAEKDWEDNLSEKSLEATDNSSRIEEELKKPGLTKEQKIELKKEQDRWDSVGKELEDRFIKKWGDESMQAEGLVSAEKKLSAQAGEGLQPKEISTQKQPTIPQNTIEGLPLKPTGEQYTAKELSSDKLYQKIGVPEDVASKNVHISELTSPGPWLKFRENLSQFSTSFKERVVSDWQRVKELSETKGIKLTGDLTPYERRKLMSGRQTARLKETEEMIAKIDKDILDSSKRLGVKDKELQQDVFDYLRARHAPERNAELGPKAAGITDEEAKAIIEKIDSSPLGKEAKRIADDLQKFHNETLDILYADGKPWGVIDKELYDTLKTKYKNHVPLNRVLDTDNIGEVLSGKGLAVRGTGLKKAVGSEREVKDIMENIYAARAQAIQRLEKNIVDNETYTFAQDYIKSFPDQNLFEVIKPRAIGRTFDDKIITENINSPDVLQFQLGGKPTYLKVNDPRLAVALRGVSREQLPGLLKYVSTITRWMSALVTRFSPEFSLTNKLRDLQEAVVYMAANKDIGPAGSLKAVFKDPVSIKAVGDVLRGADTEGARLYKQMIADGGTTGGMALSTRKQIEDSVSAIRKTARSNPRKAFKMFAESVDKWNTIFEDSTRLSAYRQALEQGASRERAALIAKNVSIDFNEFGTWGPVINSLYMFANASIQGSAKMIRSMKNPKVAASVIGTVGASVFAANAWNDAVDPEWRSKVSKWDKINSLNVVIPGTKEFYYVSIPVSWGLKPIKVMMEYGSDLAYGQSVDAGDAVGGVFSAAINAYNPVGGTDMASAITPSVADPFVELARNQQWSGSAIRPDWNKYAPASTQYFKDLRDSATGKYLIDATGKVSDATGGRIEISPADADYVLQQLTGGPGRFVGKVFNTIASVGKGEAPEVRDIPFVSKILRNVPQERFGTTKREAGIEKVLTEQERGRAKERAEAEIMFEELKKMPAKERQQIYLETKKSNPSLVERVDKLAKEEEKGLTRVDRQLLQLGVENGERAKFLFNVFKSASPDERKELYIQYKNKGIISAKVGKQLDYLFSAK